MMYLKESKAKKLVRWPKVRAHSDSSDIYIQKDLVDNFSTQKKSRNGGEIHA